VANDQGMGHNARRTPRVVFEMSCRFSSFKYSNESAGIRISDAPMLNHSHTIPKQTHVVSSLGIDFQTLLLFAVSNVALLGDISPKVSMEMRRAMKRPHSNAASK
jgi:hypothetical protein